MTDIERRQLAVLIRKLTADKYGKDCKHLPERIAEYNLLMALVKRLESEK